MSNIKSPPSIHLWIYNNPFYGVSDQIEFFIMTLSQSGYKVTIGREPRLDSLNVVIENFSEITSETLINFCKASRKRVAVVMTEHLDFINKKIMVHGDPLWSGNDYMHPATQMARIKNLIDCSQYIRCFFVLGDLPRLINFNQVLPGIEIYSIPFPKLFPISINENKSFQRNDLIFTGYKTDFRLWVIKSITRGNLLLYSPEKFVSRRVRGFLNQNAKIILNIPQRVGWHWLSSMRVIAGLKSGRATVSLGTNDSSEIAKCCIQIDISQVGWQAALDSAVQNWGLNYENAYKGYDSMITAFNSINPFPHSLFKIWQITDGLVKVAFDKSN